MKIPQVKSSSKYYVWNNTASEVDSENASTEDIMDDDWEMTETMMVIGDDDEEKEVK